MALPGSTWRRSNRMSRAAEAQAGMLSLPDQSGELDGDFVRRPLVGGLAPAPAQLGGCPRGVMRAAAPARLGRWDVMRAGGSTVAPRPALAAQPRATS